MKKAGVKNPTPARTQRKLTPKQQAVADGLAKRKKAQAKKK